MPRLPAMVTRWATPCRCASVPRGGPAPAGPVFTEGITVDGVEIERGGAGRGAAPGHSIYRGHRRKALDALIIAVPGYAHATQETDLGVGQKAPRYGQVEADGRNMVRLAFLRPQLRVPGHCTTAGWGGRPPGRGPVPGIICGGVRRGIHIRGASVRPEGGL